MRLPDVSPWIERRGTGATAAGAGRVAVRPQQVQNCTGTCSVSSTACVHPERCECNTTLGRCVPKGH